jgi:hypothetical protein
MTTNDVVQAAIEGNSAETQERDTWVLFRHAGDWLVESFQSNPENAARRSGTLTRSGPRSGDAGI